MKNLILTICLSLSFVACNDTAKVSDGIKSLVLSKSLSGGKKMPWKVTEKVSKDYSVIQDIVAVEVDSTTWKKLDDENYSFSGKVVTSDKAKLEAFMTSVMLTGSKDLERSVASANMVMEKKKNHKPKRKSKSFDAKYRVDKDGTEWLTSVKFKK